MIPANKIVNIAVKAPKRATVLARMKQFQDIPEWFKCCPQKVGYLDKVAGKIERRVFIASGRVAGNSHCGFCAKQYPEHTVMDVVPTGDGSFIAVPLYDFDEGSIDA